MRRRSSVGRVSPFAAWLCVALHARHAASAEGIDGPAPAVTVSGQRSAPRHSPRDATAASTVVEGEALRAPGATSADVLSRVPGVQVARSGSQSELATASIRGSTSAQVPVYVAGIRINDDVTGTADLSTVPLFMIERVEVFRGNAPAGAEQLGMGGAVFFWPRLPGETRLGAGVGAGSFGARSGFVAGEVGSRSTGALVALRAMGADNDYTFVNDQGQRFDRDDRVERRRNADFASQDAWAVGRHRAGRTHVTTVLHAFEREQGVTGASVVPAESARATARRLLAGASVRTPCSASDACRLDLQSSFIGTGLTLEDPRVELPSLRTRLAHGRGRRTSHRVGLTTLVVPEVEVGASVLGAHESLSLERLSALPRSADRTTLQGAMRVTAQATRALVLHAHGTIECHTTQGNVERFGQALTLSGDACGIAEPSGRVGASLELARGLELLSNVSRYVRPPTLGELYGSAPLMDGNTELRPEVGVGADVGVRASGGSGPGSRLGLDAFAFGRTSADLIRYRRTGLGTAAPYNVGSARVLGAEVLLAAEWLHALRAETALTVLDARETTRDTTADPTANDLLPLTPRLVAASRLEVFAEPGLSALRQSRVSLAVLHLYRASRHDDPAGQTVLPAQSTFDVEIASAHLAGALALRLAVRNVLDARQLDFIGLPLPGRSAHGEVEAWW